jgi:hypothetical protein
MSAIETVVCINYRYAASEGPVKMKTIPGFFFRLGHTLLLIRWDLLPHFRSGSIDDRIFLGARPPLALFLKLNFPYNPNVTGFMDFRLTDWCI